MFFIIIIIIVILFFIIIITVRIQHKFNVATQILLLFVSLAKKKRDIGIAFPASSVSSAALAALAA